MTDRELLERAARAAGMRVVSYNHTTGSMGYEGSGGRWWNPLTDDGDALRLAVRLRMTVRVEDYGTAARIEPQGAWSGCEAHLHGGTESATRRAIVRAAAAMVPETGAT